MTTASAVTELRYLEDRWDDKVASTLDEQELLRYRSNLLGSDLRITNFGGGNTSSKIVETDPLDGSRKPVLWVKGSGGDLGSIKRSGFATLYLDKVLALADSYRGVAYEDEMVDMYPLCTFGKNPRRCLDRYRAAWFSSLRSRRSSSSGLGHRAGGLGQWHGEDGRVQCSGSATRWSGSRGSVLVLNWA